MATFKTRRDFHHFATEVKEKARYIHSSETTAFLRAVASTIDMRREHLPKDSILYRAQRGCIWKERPADDDEGHIFVDPAPYERARFFPSKDHPTVGRAHAFGIPCLYFSLEKETAMSEVRPWIGSHVSVARFRTVKEISMVNCSVHHTHGGLEMLFEEDDDASPGRLDRIIWGDIDYAFAKPVSRDDDWLDYVPTQILSELFRQHSIDAIGYKSKLLEHGYNLALFDVGSVAMEHRDVFEVASLHFCFQNAY